MPVAVGQHLLEREEPLPEVIQLLEPLRLNAFRLVNCQNVLKSSVVVAGFETQGLRVLFV